MQFLNFKKYFSNIQYLSRRYENYMSLLKSNKKFFYSLIHYNHTKDKYEFKSIYYDLLFQKKNSKFIYSNNLSKFNKYHFKEYEFNKTGIERKKIQIEEEKKILFKNSKIKINFLRILKLFVLSFLFYYVVNAKEIFRRLKLDKLIISKIKKKEKEHNIDLNFNDKIIREFDEKYGINRPIDDFMSKLQYGNKEFNQEDSLEEQINSNDNNELRENKIMIDLDSLNSINKNKTDIENNVKILEHQIVFNGDEKRNVRMIKAENFEQISIYDKNFDNPDPRILGSTIVFDSRLDKKK